MGLVKVTSLLIKPESALGFVYGVRAQTEMEIWCVTCARRSKYSILTRLVLTAQQYASPSPLLKEVEVTATVT